MKIGAFSKDKPAHGMDWLLTSSREYVKYDYRNIRLSLMRKKITATEAVRKFSEILSRVHYQGDSYTVVRGGSAVASILPVSRAFPGRTLGELKSLLASIPKLGVDADAFESDVKAARDHQPFPPKRT